MILKDNKDDLILNNLPLVKKIASKYYTGNVLLEFDDLVSYGVIGLMDAIEKFDENKGAKFSSYAALKIQSYIIDEIRKHSPISRGNVKKIKSYQNNIEYLQNKLLREPTNNEIIAQMDTTSDEIKNIEKNISLLKIDSLDILVFDNNGSCSIGDTIEDNLSLTPDNIVENKEKIELLSNAIEELSERDQLVLSLYYSEELKFKEIGQVLDISESRVCQIHGKAIKKLRGILSV